MATPGKVDYHIHYFVDGCAHEEMTLSNIEAESARLGLEEICVLKHYSEHLPNKQEKWVNWKRIISKQFTDFLVDIRSFRSSSGIRILAGVETELLNDAGKINIPERDIGKLDAINLSVHWLPDMKVLRIDPVLWPGDLGRNCPEAAVHWREQVKDIGAGAILENFVLAYVQAIEHNSKVRLLAHMFDGLRPLREYEVMVDDLGKSKLIELMEPLMKACAEKHILWELTPSPVICEFILKRANEIGVHFSATADAHFLQTDGWANLRDHDKAEAYINSLGLTKGVICI
jgi:histidinol phosphatase-like PHP family hydrolase